jgi:hypothetical protein
VYVCVSMSSVQRSKFDLSSSFYLNTNAQPAEIIFIRSSTKELSLGINTLCRMCMYFIIYVLLLQRLLPGVETCKARAAFLLRGLEMNHTSLEDVVCYVFMGVNCITFYVCIRRSVLAPRDAKKGNVLQYPRICFLSVS